MIKDITIDDVIDYITIVLLNDPIEYELLDSELHLMIDTIRDTRHIMNISYQQSSGIKYI